MIHVPKKSPRTTKMKMKTNGTQFNSEPISASIINRVMTPMMKVRRMPAKRRMTERSKWLFKCDMHQDLPLTAVGIGGLGLTFWT